MLSCKTAKVISKKRDGKEYFYIRLNVINPDSTAKSKYSTKDIFTGLTVSVRHKREAEKMVQTEIDKFNSEQFLSGATTNNNSSSISGVLPQNDVAILFPDYCEDWLKNKEDSLCVTTYEGYRYKIAYIQNYFEGRRLCDIKPQDVRDFYHHLYHYPKSSPAQEKEEGLSDRSISDIAKLLRSIFEDAITLEYLERNPASRIKIPQRNNKPREKSFVSQNQIQIFRECIRGHKLERLFLFDLFFGLRRGELIGLKWSCIRDNKLHIEHTITRMKTTVARDQVKTQAGYRSLVIPDKYRDMLDDIRHEQQRYKQVLGNTYNDQGYIFTKEDGSPYSPDYVTKQFKKIVRAEPRLSNDLTLHSLRRSCITALLTAGVPVKTVQGWAGHADSHTTLDVYAQIDPSTFTNASHALINYIFDAPEVAELNS